MIIRSRAPLRISFAGGGTDVPPFPELYGGCVLSCTIDKYAYSSLTPKKDKKISIHSIDFNLVHVLKTIAEVKYGGKLDLPIAVLKLLKYNKKGFDLTISCDRPPGSGLGSSSAVVVSVIGVMKRLLNLSLSSYDMANLAVRVEREELQIKGGLQDQYASTFGGFNFIEFSRDKQVLVSPLRIKPEVENELISRLLLIDTQVTRFSGDILSRHVKAFEKRREEIVDALKDSKENAIEMKDSLLRGEIDQFGELLETGWEQKKRRDDNISNKQIDTIYHTAKNSGVVGGKLLGAGGGGHIILLCEYGKKYEVERKMAKLGCNILPFSFENSGIQTWKINLKRKSVEI
jgi:D-glycero-alpha-D-manno-heptose-7-phosphate kinase